MRMLNIANQHIFVVLVLCATLLNVLQIPLATAGNLGGSNKERGVDVEPKSVSIYSLLAVPKIHDHELVKVAGYLATNNICVVISPDKESLIYGVYENFIRLDYKGSSSKTRSTLLAKAPGHLCLIEGIVRSGPVNLPRVVNCRIVPCAIQVRKLSFLPITKDETYPKRFRVRTVESEECTYGISAYALLINPGLYHGKTVASAGLFIADWEGLRIFSPNSHAPDLNESFIYLDFSSAQTERSNELTTFIRDKAEWVEGAWYLEEWSVVVGVVDNNMKGEERYGIELCPLSLTNWKVLSLK